MKIRWCAECLRRFAWDEREVLLAFVATRLLICALAVGAFSIFQPGEAKVLPSALPWNLFFRWDAVWYARIVQLGYDYAADTRSSVNFFPLFPLLLGAVRRVTGWGTPFAGFAIANTALLGAGICLRRVALLDFSGRIPERAVWLLFLCPATFFHSAGYPESLFILLSLGAILFARKGRWPASGAAGALLTASHGNALLIMLPLGWEAFVQSRANRPNESSARRFLRSFGWLALVPLGLVSFAAYLYVRFGDALAFAHSQSAFYRQFDWPWTGFPSAWSEPWPNGALQLAAAAAGIFLCGLAYRIRLRPSYQLYAIAMLLLTLSTNFLTATPRLLCEIFPFYLTLAAATAESEKFYLLALTTSTGVMAISLALFVCGYPMV